MLSFLFLSFFCLATGIIANKILLTALSPEFLVGLRMILAAILLFVFAYRRGESVSRKQFFASLGLLIGVSLFTTFFPSNLKAFALKYMPSSKMAFFGTLDPFIAALYSYFVYNEKLSFHKLVGVLFGLAGMLVLIISSSPLEEQHVFFSMLSYPELAAFLAIVISRFGWIQIQELVKKEAFTPVQINYSTMALGGSISLIAALFRDTTSIGAIDVPRIISWMSPEWAFIVLLAYTVLIGNVFGYTLYAHSLKHYSVTFITLAGFSIPLLVSLLGWLLLGERLTIYFIVACLLSFVGQIIFFSQEKKATR